MASSISVLVPQWGETDLTSRALEAVRRSRYDGEIEILVWDDGSPDGPGEIAEESDVQLIENGSNVGFAVANNQLASRATGDLLLFLNNDTLLAPSCLAHMVDCLTQGDDIAAVTPQFRGFDGQTLELGGLVGNSGEAWQIFRDQQAPRSLLQRPFDVPYSSAACMLVRRETFQAAGGFDEAFSPAYYEDTDLCFRLADMGHRIVVEPRAVAFHLEGGTAGTDVVVDTKRHQLRNRGRFAARWSRQLEKLPPVSQGAALRQVLAGPDQPLVLWLLPDFLKPDQSGGHARIRKEIEALVEAGTAVLIWSEHLGDHGRYATFLDDLGVTWCGTHEPTRSLLSNREHSCISSLHHLLELDIWDAVVAWSVDMGHRFGPMIRELAPSATYVVDSTVLLYLQCARGIEVGAALADDLVAERAWELGVYGAADALIVSSESETATLRAELPDMEIFTFDVGAYEPVLLEGQESGSLLFLGNFIHPPNLDAVVWWAEEVAPRIEQICGRILPLRIIGASSELVTEVLSAEAIAGAGLEIGGWVEDLRSEMSKARVCVVPLRYGAGTKDKISIAMCYGVPTVTTEIGAESMPDGLADALVIADDAELFAEHAVKLMTDDQAWDKSARGTRQAAQIAWQDQELARQNYKTWFSQFAKKQSHGKRPD